jgi:hypothetical protein
LKAKEIDASIERQIVTYAITSTRFLRDIFVALKPEHLKSSYAKIVVGWVIEYYKEYREAPGKHIQDLYTKNSRSIRDEEDTELVSEFLLRLSNQYKEGTTPTDKDNIDFILKNAITYLKLQAVDNLRTSLELCLLNKDPLKAEGEIAKFRRVETPRDKGVSMFEDSVSVTTAFLEEEDTLFKFPGVLGDEVGVFSRGDLIAYLAAAKRGKSWWEWYTALIGVYHGFRAVFFNLEMTRNQVVRRAWTSLTGMPRRRKENQVKRIIQVPSFSKDDEEDALWKVVVKEKEVNTIDLSKVFAKQKSFRRQFRSGNIRIFSFPAYSATVNDLQATLENLEYYDNFIPDIIVVDYADLIVPTGNFRGEYRQQLDEIWKSLRRIAQERNALVVTASQAGRAAFTADAGEKDVAEDIRKIAHVAKLISINQSKSERDVGMVRVRQLVERDDRIGGRLVAVLQCLDTGQVCIDSRLCKDVELPGPSDKNE